MSKKKKATKESVQFLWEAAKNAGYNIEDKNDRARLLEDLNKLGCEVAPITVKRWFYNMTFPVEESGEALAKLFGFNWLEYCQRFDFSQDEDVETREDDEENSCGVWGSSSLSYEEVCGLLPTMIEPIADYAHLFPGSDSWKYLIEQEFMRDGYSVSITPSIGDFKTRAYVKWQLKCLENEGVTEEAIQSLLMWLDSDKPLPNNLLEVSQHVVRQYVDITLEGIMLKSSKFIDLRERENASGDYLDYRFDMKVDIDNLYYFLSKFLRLEVSGWFPVDYRLLPFSEMWKDKEREKNIREADNFVAKGNCLLGIPYCHGIYEYGSANSSIFDSFFETKEVPFKKVIGMVIIMARARNEGREAREYLEWYSKSREGSFNEQRTNKENTGSESCS